MPYPADWIGDKILFSANIDDATNLWEVPIRAGTWRITGKADRLTSVAGTAVSSSAVSEGRFVFANLSQQTHLWMLPMDMNTGVVKEAPRQLTESDAAEYFPSVSEDGTRLAFTSTRNGKQDIWLKDLHTGAETRIPPTGDRQEFPKFSHDGRRLAFTVIDGQQGTQQQASTYILSLDSMRSQRVSGRADWAWAWSPDDRYLLSNTWGDAHAVQLLEPLSGRMKEFLLDSNDYVFQLTFSPDGHWIAFNGMSGIFVARYHGPQAVPKRDWIRITDGFFDDKPRWSPDGSMIYFLSDRDGSFCLWLQRVNPATNAPIGAPVPVYHFHSGRRSIENMGAPLADIAVSRDGVIFPQAELKGNIWMTSRGAGNLAGKPAF
jgi:Tol biopolymer transport system component